ncbi:tyrosine-type recombinase/integrase [Saccharopolyspora spinosa]|uniref:Site-specific recombinase XerD n=1 Tax=Saccharopolyspora spinosa TaxID=60894 RepID=A0A2N3XSL4_SACSN|nr:tyrosine-type recombinase/integrase [Saccharopolyspora spinosa]PKW13655.1 site-specific recombinase XerD [Saccharopolyspora spinosa]
MAGDPIKRVELSDGTVRYRFVVDIGRDPKTGKRRQITKTFDTKREAKAEHARIKHQTGEGSYVAPSKLTVGDWLDTWLKSATVDLEKATARSYQDALRCVYDLLGDRKLQTLTEEDIDDLIRWMLTSGRKIGGKPGTGLGLRSVQLMLNRLRAALNEAVRRRLVVRNVAEAARIPKAAREAAAEAKAERTPWSTEEVKAFLATIREDRLYAPMLLSLMGLRPAEACGLRWTPDVDLEAQTVKAGDNTRTLVVGEVVEKGAKSEAGKRGLPLPVQAVSALKAFRARQAAEKLAAGEAYEDSGYVVVDELGRAVKTDWLRRRFYKLIERAGVRKVRLYDARHACLTYLATSGVPDVIVSAWAGHADLSFTKRVYIHPNADHLKVAADQLGELLG